jgi:hypothetical protein
MINACFLNSRKDLLPIFKVDSYAPQPTTNGQYFPLRVPGSPPKLAARERPLSTQLQPLKRPIFVYLGGLEMTHCGLSGFGRQEPAFELKHASSVQESGAR